MNNSQRICAEAIKGVDGRREDPWKITVFIKNVKEEGFSHLYLLLEMEDATDCVQGNAAGTSALNKKGDDGKWSRV